MLALFFTFSYQDLRRHPWRSMAAIVAVMLGVALALAVHLINASALDEFAQAIRSVNGQPDVEIRAMQGSLAQELYADMAAMPSILRASPVLEQTVLAQPLSPAPASNNALSAAPPTQPATALRIVGADALILPAIAPSLMPQPWPHADRLSILAPATVFLNPAAITALGIATDKLLARPTTSSGNTPAAPPENPSITVTIQGTTHTLVVAGTTNTAGAPLAVMDIGAAQDLFAMQGQLSRIDVQWPPGSTTAELAKQLRALAHWPSNALMAAPGDTSSRINNLSRAYRVNLTVLALVALFTGAYLVFSVRALSVTQRAAQWALLAVLGATPRQRGMLVLLESAALGIVGSMAGVALGVGMAAAALHVLGGDLGGGYFAGIAPRLQWSTLAAVGYGVLGIMAALAGGWWPARTAQRLPPAPTLKGVGLASTAAQSSAIAWSLLIAGGLLTLAPPIANMALAAYTAIALLLIGGIALLPWVIGHLLSMLAPLTAQRPLALLALERARRMRGQAAMAVGGVVASMSLAVALTVMVGSFRGSVIEWLDMLLPSPIYARSVMFDTSGDSDAALLPQSVATQAAALPALAQVRSQRLSSLQLQANLPALTIVSRPIDGSIEQELPLVGDVHPTPKGHTSIYISEAVVALYGVHAGQPWPALAQAFQTHLQQGDSAQATPFFIAGVWRDYARQSGSIIVSSQDFQHLTGDTRISQLGLWPREGADWVALQADLQRIAQQAGTTPAQSTATPAPALTFYTASAIREQSLRIFDRSFAVTYWLQAVAIGIGLFGIAASFSAQVLSRRKEFGLLAHLGLTREHIVTVVVSEGIAWTALGTAAGIALGLAVAVVLVKVVNPQSFYWTMDVLIPWSRLGVLSIAVIGAGTATAWLAGRSAASHQAVLAVKEDW